MREPAADLRGASLEALENIAVRQDEDVASKETGLLEKGRFCKVQTVGATSGAGPRLFVRLLDGATAGLEGWISSKSKTGRALVEVRSAAAVLAGIQDGREDAPLTPSLATILRSIDHAEGKSLSTATGGSKEDSMDQKELAHMSDAKAYPAFLNVQAPDPDYVAKVNERRLRLMAQEKARRQARNQRLGKPSCDESVKAQPSRLTGRAAASHAEEQAVQARTVQADETGGYSASISSAKHDFTGVWQDGSGNSYVLVQRGSIVSERKRLGTGESAGCGLAMRNELTMFGSIGTLTGDMLRWADDRSVWTRKYSEVAGEVSSSLPASACREAQPVTAGPAAPQRQAKLPPDLADLVTPGPDIPSTEWEDLKLPKLPRYAPSPVAENHLRQVRAREAGSTGNQRLWFEPWQDER
eukprot:CAMPEP_0197631168 /NCGR_PEP_ID=MMETSP1338-20131121/8426_1 /TAXON_ID=43686 ORGANISM="Pelagodinium beii, Strain RCC1491" /NCGR_SAMPLE_ID=MMETSP1338 /ASSEMBLY_ACC=CAM_ASM_000754 /LENGTH=412 /DNA_ID=CAMNT_0043202569 /DNA_START=42 /DNA_END=1280 /DNA_ORIENTATION=-